MADIVKKRLGENALESINDYRLCSWLSHQEDVHRMVFYIADSHCSPSAWTRRCLRQADCVVLLALASADEPTKLSPIEQAMSCLTTKVTKILVLLYPLETEYPPAKRTAAWLNTRPWVTQHYHIRCPPRVLNPTVKNLIAFYSQVFLLEEPNQHSDMSRLARYLTGQAVGLVLGGGGAKGAAHVGVIRVLQVGFSTPIIRSLFNWALWNVWMSSNSEYGVIHKAAYRLLSTTISVLISHPVLGHNCNAWGTFLSFFSISPM